jgi:hypothetical protein
MTTTELEHLEPSANAEKFELLDRACVRKVEVCFACAIGSVELTDSIEVLEDNSHLLCGTVLAILSQHKFRTLVLT